MKEKMLFVSARLPYPAVEGHQKRSIGFLTEYAKKYDITLLSIQRVGESLEKNSPLLSLCEKVITVPVKTTKANLFTSVIKSLFNRLPVVVNRYVTKSLIDQFVNIQKEQHFDILHLDLLPLAQLANFTSIPTKILNQHNVESVLVEQRVELERFFLNKLILKYEFKNLHQFEVKHCSEFPLVLCCSENDKLLLNKFGATNVCVAPNGVYVDEFSKYSDYSDDRSAVFLGGMGWYPNKIGMQWFVDEVLPIVVSAVPDFQLNVVGNSQPAISIPDIYSNNINILGFVDDLQKIVCASNVMIVPITVGSGTRLKVVEGIAMGRAIVSTKKGAEGVNLADNESVMFADDATVFANKLIELLNDQSLAKRLGENARDIAVHQYDWQAIGSKVISAISAIGDSDVK